MEEIITEDPDFFIWMVETFQNITPKQAECFYIKTGVRVPPECIQDVTPYDHHRDDPDRMYMELCDTQDYQGVMKKYRVEQLNLF